MLLVIQLIDSWNLCSSRWAVGFRRKVVSSNITRAQAVMVIKHSNFSLIHCFFLLSSRAVAHFYMQWSVEQLALARQLYQWPETNSTQALCTLKKLANIRNTPVEVTHSTLSKLLFLFCCPKRKKTK